MIYRALDEVVAATGQFRVVQVKLIPYCTGMTRETLGHYMAICAYEGIRHRMGRSETLYFHAERPDSTDAFYLLIDAFRYQIMMSRIVRRPPVLAKPSSKSSKSSAAARETRFTRSSLASKRSRKPACLRPPSRRSTLSIMAQGALSRPRSVNLDVTTLRGPADGAGSFHVDFHGQEKTSGDRARLRVVCVRAVFQDMAY